MKSKVVRGAVFNPGRASQLRDYSGLRYGNMTPTDIDGLLEYLNRCFVLIETKVRHSGIMPRGQELALTRLVDAVQAGGKPMILFSTIHDTPRDQAIDMANTEVDRYYWNGSWHQTAETLILKNGVDRFLEKYGKIT